MKNISKVKKIFIICILLNVVVFGAYTFLYINIKSMNVKTSTLLSEVESSTERDSELRSIKASLSENREFISKIDSYFISKNGVVDFINTLEALGKESGVSFSIGSVSVDSSKNKNDFKDTLKLRIDTTGDWHDIYHFLSILESLPYRVQFEQVSFSLSSQTDSLLFSSSTEAKSRTRSEKEFWKGSFDIILYKLN